MDFRGYELYSLCIPLYSSFHSCCRWPPRFSTLDSLLGSSFNFYCSPRFPCRDRTYASNLFVRISTFSICQSLIRLIDQFHQFNSVNNYTHWLKYLIYSLLINFSLETFTLYKSKNIDICLNKKGKGYKKMIRKKKLFSFKMLPKRVITLW